MTANNPANNPQNNSPKLNQQEFTIDTELVTYHRELASSIADAHQRINSISREMQRHQDLLQAAMAIRNTQKDRLTAEQQKLNDLEEQSRQAMLHYTAARQQLDRLMHAYNQQLEFTKQLRTKQDDDAAAITEQQKLMKDLMNEWQRQSFFLQKQQKLNQEVESRLAAGNAHNIADLPPISELQPPTPRQKQEKPVAKATHANAGFWDNKQHTALDPDKLNKADFADTATPYDAAAAAKPKRKSIFGVIMSYVLCIALAVTAAFAIREWIIVPTHVSGTSMQPTLQSNDKILTSPLPYLMGEPQRGDIIVFPAPDTAEDDSVYYVKRIIALPGDHLEISDGSVYINDQQLDEDYLLDDYTGGYIDTLIPEGSLFVMGDNRQVSHDSRDTNVSFIDIADIRGKALWRIYPLEEIGSVY